MKALLRKVGFMTLAIPMFLMGSVTGASAAEDGYHEEEKTIKYWCDSVVDFQMPVTIKATVPDSVEPGGQVMFLNSTATVTLPENPAVNVLRGFPYYADSITGEVTKFNISSQNEASTINVASTPIQIPKTTVPSSGSMTFTVPGNVGIDAGPFTAGQSGNLTITAGDIDTTVHPESFLGGIIPINASCSPLVGEDTVLTTVPIVED